MPATRHNQLVLAVDLGTSGCKCALVGMDGVVQRWNFRPVPLHIVDQVGAEQAPEDWWGALRDAAREVLAALPELGGEVAAICCSCQGECTVPVDRAGNPLHRAILWIDMRGSEPLRRRVGNSWFSVAGYDPLKLWRWISRTGGAPALSGKDSAGHIAFIREAKPAIYQQTYKFLSALDYINFRLTGRFVATVDSILTSWVTDNRQVNNIHYDEKLLAQTGIAMEKLPEIVHCTDVVGPLCPSAARELGLSQATVVVAGSVDVSAAAVGSGAVGDGETHIYVGTSCWIGAHVPFKKTNVVSQIASVPCAVNGRYLAIAMQSSAGASLSFLCDKILFHRDALGGERPDDAYAILDQIAASVEPGARGLLFTPWLFGERSPVDDPYLRAGVLNLSLEHSRAELIRAVLEGVALNTRWMAGPFGRFLGKPLDQVTMVGGGAKSDLWCQIFADVLGIPIRQPEAPIQANAIGAALIGFVGIGAISYNDIAAMTRIRQTYHPDPGRNATYDEVFEAFRLAHKRLEPLYRRLNRGKVLR